MTNEAIPNFLCVGAQKAGTTTMHDILKQHPDIYLPDTKEAHFFDIDSHYEKSIDWWLNTFFSSYDDQTSVGAMTPEYLYYKEVPSRILETLGKDVKIIILLRNPVSRAYSHYLMSKRRGFEEYSFQKAISLEAERIEKGEFEKNHFSYISRGLYLDQVKRYVDLFPKKNILVIKFEDELLANKEKTISKVLNFLDVSDIPLNIHIKSNKATQSRFKLISKLIHNDGHLKRSLRFLIKSSSVKIKINQYINRLNQTTKNLPSLSKIEKKHYLNKYFLDEIKQLEVFLNINLESWYK